GRGGLGRTVRERSDVGVEWRGVVGGDGARGRTLCSVSRCWAPSTWPAIVPFGGGTMNTIARSLGVSGPVKRLAAGLRSHIAGVQYLVPTERWLLDVDGTRRGFLFGNGLFARYIEAYEMGEPGPGRAASVLARATLSAMVGGPFSSALGRPVHARLEVDGELLAEGPWLVASAGTVEQVGLGFRPFMGAIRQPGSLHALGIGCTAGELALQLPLAFRGRPFTHPKIVECVGKELVIRANEPQLYMMDGDLTQGGPVVRVAMGPKVTFWVPRAPTAQIERPSEPDGIGH
ncbi:MAG: diacylglycerol kinase family protein, partial [Myxococcota bacterium]